MKDDPSMRDVASAAEVDALAEQGPAAIPRLLAWLDHPRWVVRRAVVANLADMPDAVAPLAEQLVGDRSSETRIAATVDALVAATGPADAAVMALADHPDPHVVADVAQILGRRKSQRGVPTLIRLTAHADDNVAAGAMEALGRIGTRAAVDALLVCLDSPHFFRAFPAIDVLSRTDDPRVVAPLARKLADPRYAHEAARALGRTGDRLAVAPLVPLLSAAHEGTVRVACLALQELRERHVERFGMSTAIDEALRSAGSDAVARRLEQCSAKAKPSERVALCAMLGVLGNPASVPLLERFLEGPPEVARAAAVALETIGKDEGGTALVEALVRAESAGRRVLLPLTARRDAAPSVVACLSDADATVRALACDRLARLGAPEAVPALFARLDDANARVVQAATAAIQSLGSSETERLALHVAAHGSPVARRAALRIIGTFAYPAALPLLREAARDPDPRLRDAAIHGLALFEAGEARTLLRALATDPEPSARAAALRALGEGERAEDETAAVLMAALRDTDPWVRYYAAQALGRLRVLTAVPRLAELLDDAAGQVRVSAVEALSHLKTEDSLSALRRALDTGDPDMQRAALLGLSLSAHHAALPRMLAACASPDPATRLVALSAVASFDDPSVLEELAEAASTGDEHLRTAALGFLAQRPERRATALLVGLLPHQTGTDQAVVNALATPAPERVSGLLDALHVAQEDQAALLCSCLARLQEPAAQAALETALGSANAPARCAALAVLSAMGHRDAPTFAARLSAQDPDPSVRRVAAVFLGQ